MISSASTTAFLLRSHSYGESDRIVTFITEGFGKLSGIAKGAKRSQRRFAGTLEPFVRVRVAFRSRPRSDLAFIDRCEFLQALRGFSHDLGRFALGTYLLELTDRMVLGRETGSEVFRLVDTALSLLDSEGPAPAIVRGFELHLLDVAGYRPHLDACRGCSTPAARIRSAVVVPSRGGLLCGTCHGPADGGQPLGNGTLDSLLRLQRTPLDAGAAGTVMNDHDAAHAEAAMEALIGHVIPRPLRSRTIVSALLHAGRDVTRTTREIAQ